MYNNKIMIYCYVFWFIIFNIIINGKCDKNVWMNNDKIGELNDCGGWYDCS